jgi:hypothetical protein
MHATEVLHLYFLPVIIKVTKQLTWDSINACEGCVICKKVGPENLKENFS